MRWTDALFSSPRCGLELPAAQIGGGRAPVAGCVSTGRPVWMVDPPETRWAGGWGTPPSRPSNQGRPGGTRGGSASPHWLAVNKRGPTPCKHASLESWEGSRCCPTVPRQPWRPSATQQFDPSPLDSRPPLRRTPCHQDPPVVQQPEAGPPTTKRRKAAGPNI